MDIRKKRKLLAYGMKAFYLLNYTDACGFTFSGMILN